MKFAKLVSVIGMIFLCSNLRVEKFLFGKIHLKTEDSDGNK